MHYVFVGTEIPISLGLTDYTPALVNQTRQALISIINGLRGKDFGKDTIDSTVDDIKAYKVKYIDPVKAIIFIDSGGYSIIKGDVSPYDVVKVNNVYHYVLEYGVDTYHYIFSLDIPFFKEFPEYNTKAHIEAFNRRSLMDSKEILIKHAEIRDKFYFIWQFKIIEQYDIWKKLYEELELNKIIKCRALGGMVSLRGITQINFSPFIALSYRCLLDYLTAEDYGHDFRLHFLGVYIKYDRFQMVFMEELFKHYLQGISRPMFTYDSINYIRTAQLKKELEIYSLDGRDINKFNNPVEVPDNILRQVYFTPELFTAIQQEIDRRKNRQDLANINAFAALNVYSNLSLDRFFYQIIKEYEIVEAFLSCKGYIQLDARMGKIFKDIGEKYPEIFTNQMVNSLKVNIDKTFNFHKWYRDRRDYVSLDRIIYPFIETINFPARLL